MSGPDNASNPPANCIKYSGNLFCGHETAPLGLPDRTDVTGDGDKHAGRTAVKTFANDIKLHVYYSTRVSMSSVWLIRELFGWGHWTWRWGHSQRCEKVDYQDWSPCQPRGAPSMVNNRRYIIKGSIQLKGELAISEGSCAEYHVMASGT
ncbi:hypothetical protein GGX14DRAFT_398496 [Mycena pura]|uniref:Uncharacterized protein n=1 Tax=Mycena pura TaxID=153505 RepID=A0AAD6V6J7_9AGAR|nr:hypothetical protein GGX14DRAFT_398496 [Mycena pura]